RPQDLAQAGLRRATAAVRIRRVDQGDAEVERAVHHAARRREVHAAAEIVAAETDNGDFEIGGSELAGLHRAIHCVADVGAGARGASGVRRAPSPHRGGGWGGGARAVTRLVPPHPRLRRDLSPTGRGEQAALPATITSAARAGGSLRAW